MKKAKLLIDCKNHLGEGVVWSQENQQLYWLNIPMPSKLFCLDFISKKLQIHDMPEMITSIALRPNKNLLIASHYSLNNFNLVTKNFEKILDIETEFPENRCNDGAVDAKGRYWFGTMQNNITPDAKDIPITKNNGSIYRVDKNMNIQKIESNICISNTFVWSPNNKYFYFTDTVTGIISRYEYDLETGNISNKKDFAKSDRGFPDGSTVDSEGYLWSCRWAGSCVLRFDKNGKVDDIIELPVENITSCTFGGQNMQTLFITTARWGMSEEYLKEHPEAGGIFSIDLNVKGMPDNTFLGK